MTERWYDVMHYDLELTVFMTMVCVHSKYMTMTVEDMYSILESSHVIWRLLKTVAVSPLH
jgi:hypothetical protein